MTRAGYDRILAAAGERYDTTPREILTEVRYGNVVKARQAVAWIMRQYGYSYPVIGAHLGRDHTTIIHAVRKVENDPALRLAACHIAVAAKAIERAGKRAA